MNDVGEAFFSSPIDPTDILTGLGPIGRRSASSSRRQRNRQYVDVAGDDVWQRISHGFQVSGMLQVLLGAAIQCHLRSGQPAGDDEPAARQRFDAVANFDVRAVELIPRNAGKGSDFFALNLRVSRAFRISGGVKFEGLVEAFNVTNRVNNLTRNNTFGPGAYPGESASGLQPDHGSWRSSDIQFGVRLTF